MRYKWLEFKYPLVYVEWYDAEVEGEWLIHPDDEEKMSILPLATTVKPSAKLLKEINSHVFP